MRIMMMMMSNAGSRKRTD